MSISSTEGVTSPFAAFGSGAAATSGMSGTSDGTTATGSTDDKQMFLELMVTQLRYQDPLNPTDSSEFLAQSAQFTALEKMQDVADQTALLASSQLAFGASSLVGRQVSWLDDAGEVQSGTVEGATFLASGPVLTVGGEEVPLFAITGVGTPTDLGTGSDGTGSDGTGTDTATTDSHDGSTAPDGEPTL